MIERESHFVEAMAQHLYSRGMPRMTARMWAWLLICEPPEQTAEQIAGKLGVSRGAVSGAARDLATARLVHRGKRRTDRREYFSVPAGLILRLIAGMDAVLRQGREIADEGLALVADRPPTARARLEEFRDVYAYFEREWPLVVERYLQGHPRRQASDVQDRAAADTPAPAISA